MALVPAVTQLNHFEKTAPPQIGEIAAALPRLCVLATRQDGTGDLLIAKSTASATMCATASQKNEMQARTELQQ